jgi:hypothetical protein
MQRADVEKLQTNAGPVDKKTHAQTKEAITSVAAPLEECAKTQILPHNPRQER